MTPPPRPPVGQTYTADVDDGPGFYPPGAVDSRGYALVLRRGIEPRIPDEDIIDAHGLGLSDRAIARKFGMVQSVVSKRMRRMGLAPNGGARKPFQRAERPSGKTALIVRAILGGATNAEAAMVVRVARSTAARARKRWIDSGRVR